MARFLKSVARFCLKLIAVLAILVAVVATGIFFYPTLVLNPFVLSKVEPLANRYGIAWSYDELNIVAERTSFLRRQLRLDTTNFCVDTETFDLCIESFAGAVAWRWGYPPNLQEIGPLTARSPRVEMVTTPKKAESDEEFDPIAFVDSFLTTLANLQLHDISVTNGVFQMVDTQKKPTAGTNFAATVQTQDQRIRNIDIQATEAFGLPFTGIDAHLGKLSATDYGLRLQMDGDNAVTVSGTLKDLGEKYVLNLKSKITKDALRLAGVHDFVYQNQKLTISQAITASGLSQSVTSLKLSQCDTVITNPFEQEATMVVTGSCTVDVGRNGFVNEDVFLVSFPREATLRLGYKANVERSPGQPSEYIAAAQLDIDPLKTGLYRFEGKMNFDAQGTLSQWQDSELKSHLESKIIIDRFRDVVASFDKSTWAIPAPFNVLDGKIECEVSGEVESKGRALYAPIACKTELSGLRERLFIATDGTFQLDQRDDGYQPKLDLNVDLQEVALVLPPIESVTSLPRIGPDSRISVNTGTPAAKAKVLPIDFVIRINNDKPIQLYSDLTESPIPFDLDMTVARGQAPQATISSQGFKLALIKQPVKVEYLKIRLTTPDKPGDISGRISITKVDTIIKIDVFGTPEEPGYNIRSSPPMPQSDLVAQMMYGSGMDSLDGGSQQSVSETRAAMADGAIGLVSMFYLASTPIESVGYNPHSGSFRAKVRLSQSLALNVGSDFEGQNRFGLTRRISNNWSLETYAADSEGGGKAVAMLRWANRY